MDKLISFVSRFLFLGAFILAFLAVWEKLANIFGYTFMRAYSPSRILELSVVALIFVISIQLREIKNLKGQ